MFLQLDVDLTLHDITYFNYKAFEIKRYIYVYVDYTSFCKQHVSLVDTNAPFQEKGIALFAKFPKINVDKHI